MLKEKKNLPEEQEIKKEDNSINSLNSSKSGGSDFYQIKTVF